jgi:hypothetical protein
VIICHVLNLQRIKFLQLVVVMRRLAALASSSSLFQPCHRSSCALRFCRYDFSRPKFFAQPLSVSFASSSSESLLNQRSMSCQVEQVRLAWTEDQTPAYEMNGAHLRMQAQQVLHDIYCA